ncbi:hypothetical protein SAMD00019534_048180 [Acytostelium subglobosum LB1]|uniref:hypothetical protein n=1 Tax=Acytostelium subglobosum LB1 TaxID=1410327 RepID=UPI00064516F9|nr:hypothetical protein SAMD00019534_048180 [Acytostelium subglobosum LB1]GAM21643.1 hypothetical protein SAMD00019534_048180 [Acytostelium subglobosum LB1]|eukprot:XP_012755762.1 hypothetical protein SAMD00019534_048180 [Acytostelium subglobosum LB1]
MNLTVMFQSNGGLTSARNSGISQSQGEWILPLDADDTISSGFLSRSYDIISQLDRKKNNTIIISDLNGFVEDTKVEGLKQTLMSWPIPAWDRKVITKKNLLHCSALYKKDLWSSIGGYDNSLWFGWEDWDYWLRLDRSLPQGLDIHVVKDELFNYRMKPGMHSFCKDNNQLCFSMFMTLHPNEYSIEDVLRAHKTIGMEGDKIMLPLLRVAKHYPNLPYVHLWLGLVHEYSKSTKDIDQARQEYDKSIELSSTSDGGEWQPLILRSLADRGSKRFIHSKLDIAAQFTKQPSLIQPMKNVYGDIF